MKIKFGLDNLNVSTKLFLLYFICVLIPIVFINMIFLGSVKRDVRNGELERLNSTMDRIAGEFKKSINDIYYLTYPVYADTTLNMELEYDYAEFQEFYYKYDQYLRNYFQKNIPAFKQVKAMNIFTTNPTIPNSNGFQYLSENVRKSEWYRRFNRQEEKNALITHMENERTISLVQILDLHASKDKYYKILKVDLQGYILEDILNMDGYSGELFVIDNEGRVVLGTDNKYKLGIAEPFIYFSEVNIEDGSIVLERSFGNLKGLKDWRIVGAFREGFYSDFILKPWLYVIYYAFASLLIATIVTFLITRSFNWRLKIISKHMKNVEDKNFEIIDIDAGKDEIGNFVEVYNKSVKKIKELIQSEYELRIQKKNLEIENKQAQINALQSQINPHFLFNTLECIKMRSLIKNETETAQIILYLSKVFRSMLIWENDLITVKEEISLVEDFLKIQKYRFENKINYSIDVDEAALSCKIPKMTLQPFVENASLHGLESIKGRGEISIRIKAVNDFLECGISDNGAGISQEMLEQIMDDIKRDEPLKKNIGIRNVYKRLKLVYDNNFSFNIESTENKGTTIRIGIPANK